VVLCINGNESTEWRNERNFLASLGQAGYGIRIVDPRGVGKLRPSLKVKLDYTDPLAGVEENLAYNAFLVGTSLLAMRVSDVLQVVHDITKQSPKTRIVLCGRCDAALIAVLAAALESNIQQVATEGLWLRFRDLFQPAVQPINAASILPGLLHFGDTAEILQEIAPRKVLLSAGVGKELPESKSVQTVAAGFTKDPHVLTRWLSE
jgi:hypothetical protein